jgi:ferredoxin
MMAQERGFRVVLETPDGLRSFSCGEEDHIWDAAAANGIILPAICHQGRCLTCAGRLLEGSVEHDHPDSYYAEDKAEGYILLCRAMPRSDLRILTHQAWQMRAHRIALGLPAPYG